MGVSGLAVHRASDRANRWDAHGLSRVDCWQSRERSSRRLHQKSAISEDSAKPPLLLSSPSREPRRCLCRWGSGVGSAELEVALVLSAVTTGPESSRLQRAVTGLSDTVSLLRADRPPP